MGGPKTAGSSAKSGKNADERPENRRAVREKWQKRGRVARKQQGRPQKVAKTRTDEYEIYEYEKNSNVSRIV